MRKGATPEFITKATDPMLSESKGLRKTLSTSFLCRTRRYIRQQKRIAEGRDKKREQKVKRSVGNFVIQRRKGKGK